MADIEFAGKRVLVTGATGTVGSEVVRFLVEAKVKVRAMTRDPSKAKLPPGVEVVTPRAHARRGSQVALRMSQAYEVCHALTERGVIGDFRAPDMMRFGFTPLYIGEAEVRAAVEIIADVLTNRRWDTADYRKKALVT